MPWKDRYMISDERSLPDADVRWPGGRRCCVSVVVDLSPLAGPDGITPADLATPEAYFGLNGAFFALVGVLRRFGVRATFALPAVIAEIDPAKFRALQDDGHELAAHGFKREDVSRLDRTQEKARLDRTTAVLTSVAGHAPAGWYSLPRQGDDFAVGSVSPHTMDLLIEAGYAYMGNSPADDIPHYWVTDYASRRAILAMPYYYHYDDQFFLLFPAKGTGLEHPDSLLRNWRAELEAQYKRGRHFSMTLHPYAIGWPNRLHMLEEFLGHLQSFPLIWNATSAECATHWTAAFPASTHLKLEPSSWQDYPGSLS